VDPTVAALASFSVLGLAFACLAVLERSLPKAVVYSAVQSAAFAAVLYLLRAPDIVLVYVPVSVGLYPAVLFYLISKTEGEESA